MLSRVEGDSNCDIPIFTDLGSHRKEEPPSISADREILVRGIEADQTDTGEWFLSF